VLAALTTVAGFSGLLAADHPGMRSIGEVGVLSIAVCFAVAVLALHPLRRRT
jgi:predicted RND superfamily exporter protein